MQQPKRIYTNGGPVQVGGGVYIERQADHDLLRYCCDSEYVFILSSRQVGKSSLMNNVARQLKEEGRESVTLDLQGMGTDITAAQWYQGLLTRLERRFRLGLDVAAWWAAREHLGTADRFRLFLRDEVLERVPNHIVVFIDEIDTTLSLKRFSDDFFLALREMYNARDRVAEFQRLSFVLIGVATPTDLIDDPRKTPFNIGKSVTLTDFTFDEAWPLTEGFGLPEREARKVLGWVLNWTGGHPFLTQQLCRAIAEQEKNHWTEAEINDLVATMFLGTHAEQNIHLKAVRDLLTKRAPKGYEEATLRIYRDVWRNRAVKDEARSHPKSHLKLTGVVQPSSEGTLHLRNEIYRATFDERWVKEHLPVNWMKRLQRIGLSVLGTLLLLNVPLGIYLAVTLKAEKQARADAEAQTRIANEQRQKAEDQKQIAEEQKQIAEKQRQIAEKQRQIAQDNEKKEKKQREIAQQKTKEVEAAKQVAIASEKKRRHVEYASDMGLAATEFEVGNHTSSNSLLNRYLLSSEAKESRDFSWYLLWKEKHHEEKTLKGHTKAVTAVALSSDGQTLATASEDQTIRLWDKNSEEPIFTFPQHTAAFTALMFSPDGQTLVSGSEDGTIWLWDVERRELQRPALEGHSGAVTAVVLSDDGKWLVSGSKDRAIRLWDRTDNYKSYKLGEHVEAVTALALSSDGKTLASGSEDKTIRLWNVEDRALLRPLEGHRGAVTAVALSRDGKWLASGGRDRIIKLWDVKGERELRTFWEHWRGVKSLVFSHDGKTLVSGSEDQTIKLWDLEGKSEPRTLTGHSETVTSVALSRDGLNLVSGSEDKTIKLWDVARPHQGGTLPLPPDSRVATTVALSRDGKTMARVSGDHTIQLWDVARRQMERLPDKHTEAVTAVVLSDDGKWLASSSKDRTIILWDREDNYKSYILDEHNGAVMAVAFSDDGQTLVSAGEDRTIRVWDVNSRKELTKLRRRISSLTALALSRDGKRLAGVSSDQKIKLWDVASGRELPGLDERQAGIVTALALSRDGKTLASVSSEQTVKLWDVDSRQSRTLLGQQEGVRSLVFSPDGKTLAIGNAKAIQLWEVGSERVVRTLKGHNTAVTAVALSHDGKTLASSGADRSIMIWLAATEDEVHRHTPPEQWPQPRTVAATSRSSDGTAQR